MVILNVAAQNAMEVLLVEHDQVVDAVLPDGTDQPFRIWIFPRRMRGR
jgi:hypothetical protein